MSKIIISYQKDDTRSIAGRLYDYLCDRFGEENIVFGVSNLIKPGDDFLDAIQEGIQSADAIVLLIGTNWMESGWLADPNHYDRIAISTAINSKVRMVPVLIDGGTLPTSGNLPSELISLSRRSGIELKEDNFRSDVAKLVDTLKPVISVRSINEISSDIQQPISKSISTDSYGKQTGVTAYKWTNAMLPAIVAWAATGIVFLVADLSVPLPQTLYDLTRWIFVRAIFGALAGGLAGYGTARAFRFQLSSMSQQQFNGIIVGWAFAWAIPYTIRWLFGFNDATFIAVFVVECLTGTGILVTILSRVNGWSSAKNGSVWGLFILGYFITFVIFKIIQSNDVWLNALVTALGNGVLAFIAIGLSLRGLQSVNRG